MSIIGFSIYSSFIAGKLLTRKFFLNSDDEGEKSSIIKKKLNLKGRIKKNPNNINYNELFKENEDKCEGKEKGKFNSNVKNEMENDLDDKHCKNLEEFCNRVNERKEFQKFFQEDNDNTKMKGYNHLYQNFSHASTDNNKEISIVLKNNDENLINFDDQLLRNFKKTPEVKDIPKVKEVEREIIVDDLGRNDADIMNLENSLEIRKKNPCLFSRTPLANIRKNTLSSEK